MTDHDVTPTLKLQPESRRPGATWANRHIFGDMDAITALRAMPSARNIDYDVNDYCGVTERGGSPSTLRYGARHGAAGGGWPAFGVAAGGVFSRIIYDFCGATKLKFARDGEKVCHDDM